MDTEIEIYIKAVREQLKKLSQPEHSLNQNNSVASILHIPLDFLRRRIVFRRAKRPCGGRGYAKALKCLEEISNIAKGQTYSKSPPDEMLALLEQLEEAALQAENG